MPCCAVFWLAEEKHFATEGHFTPKDLVRLWQNPFVFKKNPSKIRINPFVLKKSRTFPMSEVPLIRHCLQQPERPLKDEQQQVHCDQIKHRRSCPRRFFLAFLVSKHPRNIATNINCPIMWPYCSQGNKRLLLAKNV